jgi:hypothetical protein
MKDDQDFRVIAQQLVSRLYDPSIRPALRSPNLQYGDACAYGVAGAQRPNPLDAIHPR